MTVGRVGPPSEHETVWEGEGQGNGGGPGPIALPARLRGKNVIVGWAVSLVVVLLALTVYVFTRPPATFNHSAPPPTWGQLTLAHVALTEAQGFADAHPTRATWLFTHRGAALGVLTGQNSGEGEADFLVSMYGHFQGGTGGAVLPGSRPNGDRLIVLVRAFDGQVTGTLVTDQAFSDLSQLGIVHTLRLGGL